MTSSTTNHIAVFLPLHHQLPITLHYTVSFHIFREPMSGRMLTMRAPYLPEPILLSTNHNPHKWRHHWSTLVKWCCVLYVCRLGDVISIVTFMDFGTFFWWNLTKVAALMYEKCVATSRIRSHARSKISFFIKFWDGPKIHEKCPTWYRFFACDSNIDLPKRF